MPNSPLGMLLGGFCSLSWRLLHQQSLLKEQDHMLGHTKAGEFEKSLHVLSAPRLVYLHPLNYLFISSTGHLKSDEAQEHLHHTQENGSNPDKPTSDFKNLKYASDTTALETMDNRTRADDFSTLHFNSNGLVGSDHLRILADFGFDNELLPELTPKHTKLPALKMNSALEAGPSILQILHLICNGNEESSTEKKSGALQQLIAASVSNNQSIWSKFFNQILTTVLEVLDDSDSSSWLDH